jgi:hypothetical protein
MHDLPEVKIQERAAMKRLRWQIIFGFTLVILSAAIYTIHYFFFRDAHHIFIYLVGDIAFVPIEVLFVTLIIHRMLRMREQRAMLKKLNMVIGAFFSEVGQDLLKLFVRYDPNSDELRNQLLVSSEWSRGDFLLVKGRVMSRNIVVDPEKADFEELRGFLNEKRGFLLTLLQNPNLLEHESFTQLLWAVFHLTEELVLRKNIKKTGSTDLDHLSGDIRRAYGLIIIEWLQYTEHLKADYPYLFSLAVRTNPFDPAATVQVGQGVS